LRHPGRDPMKPKDIFEAFRGRSQEYNETLLDHFENLIRPNRNR